MSLRRQPEGKADKISIRINRVPHPHPHEAEDLIARLVVKDLVSHSASSEEIV